MKTKSNSPILRKFAQKVRRFRVKKGWTQSELADRAGVHRTYIGSIERYERNVSLSNIERIAKALNINIKELF
jgi:transcriptional regulator with XRE-family HTH domain